MTYRTVLASLSLLLAAGCAANTSSEPAEEETGAAEEAVKINEQNIHNSLEPQSLFLSPIAANPTALDRLVSDGLQQTLNSTYMRLQLHAPTGVRTMKYVVECALDQTQSVSTSDAITGAPLSFKGLVGLCTDWLGHAPSPECQQKVSACVLARVNMVGVRVPISLHGDGATGDDGYLPEAVLKSKWAISSYNACTSTSYGPERNCGWWPVGVGSCQAGETVTIGAGANAANCQAQPLGVSNGQDTMLRVCTDIYSCDTTSPSSDAYYSRRLASNDDSCGTRNPSVSFVCPSSGNYAVMAANYDSSLAPLGGMKVGASTGVFPLTEPQVFPYVEGAFYGNIFLSAKLDSEHYQSWVDEAGQFQTRYVSGQVNPPLYAGGFACYSARINDGGANLQQRLCTLGACLIPIAGACRQQAPGTMIGAPYRCAESSVPTYGGQYGRCTGTDGLAYEYPVTTFLHNTCDTVTPLGGAVSPPYSCQPWLTVRDY